MLAQRGARCMSKLVAIVPVNRLEMALRACLGRLGGDRTRGRGRQRQLRFFWGRANGEYQEP